MRSTLLSYFLCDATLVEGLFLVVCREISSMSSPVRDLAIFKDFQRKVPTPQVADEGQHN